MSWCETEMQKYMPLVKQNVMKFEVFILGGQRKEIRDGGEGVERGSQKVTELTIEEEIRNIYTCLCLFPQGAFLLSSRLDSAVKRCSSEVLKLSFQRGCSVKGLAQRD